MSTPSIRELLHAGATHLPAVGPVEPDPLVVADALRDAVVVALSVDALSNRAALIVDLRAALHPWHGSTAVLVLGGLREVSWRGVPPAGQPLAAWWVAGSAPSSRDGVFALTVTMGTFPGMELRVRAATAEVLVGEVPGLPEAPPDLVAARPGDVAAGMAGWESPLRVLGASTWSPEVR